MKEGAEATKTKKDKFETTDGEMGIKPPHMSVEDVRNLLDESQKESSVDIDWKELKKPYQK